MPRIHAAAPDADTFRRARERASLAPEWLPPETLPDLSDIEPPTHLPLGTFLPDPEEANVVAGEIEPPLYLDDAPTPPRPHFARSRSPVELDDQERSVHAQALPPPPAASRGSVHRASVHKSVSRSVSAPTPVRARPAPAAVPVAVPAPAPVAVPVPVAVPAAVAAAAAAAAPEAPSARPSIPQFPGGIDPLLIPTPPELAPVIYGWIRRLALQADLAGADRMLRDALADLTSSLTVAIVYPGADELFSLGADEEVPKDPTPLIMVAQARKGMIASHTAILPIVTSAESVGVIMLTRNPRNPGYTPVEQVSMLCIAREAASILHHLAVEHIQRATEVKADSGSLYRGEALEAHRSRGHEGVAIELSPGWVRRTYPILVIGLLVALVFAIFIHVPTYSTGRGVVVIPGQRVPVPAAGSVEAVLVEPSTFVKKGMPMVKMGSQLEQTEYDQATKDYENAYYAYLEDSSDVSTRLNVSRLTTARDSARARLEMRTIRAPRDGVIRDIRIHAGSTLNAGDTVATIIDRDAEPVVYAFLPGNDRPRLRPGQPLQVDLTGYTKVRELATVTAVNAEVVGGREAGNYIGAELADSLHLDQGNFTLIKARLPTRTFKSQHETLYYHHGMPLGAEVKVQNKPFLVTLLPALEKYLPD